ncbi:MAG: response regulator transcription factor [Verrucomicrobiota bacterium]
MIKVAVVEDDARIRKVVTEVLASARDCQCVGAFADGATAMTSLPSLAPDVILMDINLPDVSGVECVARISPQLPGAEIIMLTVYQDPETIFRALAAGAHGYLVKPVMPGKLLEAIREIRAGGVPMSPGIAREVVDFFRREPNPPAAGAALGDASLGPREHQVLKFLVDGLTYKEIAGELGITTNTVATYVRRIYEKLHVRSRREIIAYYKNGGEERTTGS